MGWSLYFDKSPSESSYWAKLGNCFGSWCSLKSGFLSYQPQESEMLGSGIVNVPKAPSPLVGVHYFSGEGILLAFSYVIPKR